MNEYDEDFWNALDALVNTSVIVIDRPKGSAHPRFLFDTQEYLVPGQRIS